MELPFREAALVNRLVQIARRMVEILGLHVACFSRCEVANALLRFPVVLHICHLACCIQPFERMNTEAIHFAVARRRAIIGEQPG
ncbi:hypothetical protein D3C80_1724370 [compost metagenome]